MDGLDIVLDGRLCPVRETIRLLGKRWTILIIKEIFYSGGDSLGFMDLKRLLDNVSTKMLSERLKEMVADDLLNRREDDTVTPARVFYSLTNKGTDACHIIDAFRQYGLKWGKPDEIIDCSQINCELCIKKRIRKK